MKTVRFGGNRIVDVIDVAEPRPPKGHALVRMMASGVCRTDMELLYNRPEPVMITPGHEVAGIVREVNGVRQFAPGDRVMVNCHITCTRCRHCLNGDLIFCSNLRVIGFDIHGGDAEFLVVPESSLRPLPDDISFELGVIIGDALATPYHAVKKARISPGDNIGITGLGPVGLMAVVSAKHFGAKVFAMDTIPERLEQAAKFGADVGINPIEPGAADQISELTDGEGLDAVVECSGSAAAINTGLDVLRLRGKLILVGVCEKVTLNPLDQIIFKEIEIIGSRNCNNHELPELIALAREFPAIADIVTHRFPLAEAASAFEFADKHGGLKIMLVPDN